MIQIRKSSERGHADHGWLKTYYTFSFADYYDEEFMGFRSLRVINDDWVQPGRGFPTHGHRDMEIVTYVLEGALEHKDSMGTGSIIRPGEVQRMSAGQGVLHSEYNPSQTDPLHLLQIWILPAQPGGKPGYEQKKFSAQEKKNRFRLIASPDGKDGSVTIHQDARIHSSLIDPGQKVEFQLDKGRHAWAHVASGAVELAGKLMSAGDGAAISDEGTLLFQGQGKEPAEVLVFDIA